ncbi:MAG TPA: hypothetical protein ENI23_03320 [bacterium]|nr:hypothetical protein [bacterium]
MLNKFAKARKLMYETLSKDEGLYIGYQSNIAMLLYDESEQKGDDSISYNKRNELAKKIIKLIFS